MLVERVQRPREDVLSELHYAQTSQMTARSRLAMTISFPSTISYGHQPSPESRLVEAEIDDAYPYR